MSYAVVKGERLRVTKVNDCGRPLPGAANRLVTEGFIEVGLTPEMKAAEELETTNAAGKVCVKDRTPPERKRWNVALNLCDVDPDLWALIASWSRILDFDGNPIGVRDRKSVDADTGVMFELWTGGESSDDCPLPTDDSIFSTLGTGRNYGYLSFMGTEFTADGLTVNAQPSTFAFTGISKEPKQWGRGPYNVAGIDSDGTPGRLLVPFYDEDDDNHLILFRTPVAPPEVTDGAVALDIAGKFTGPSSYYYGLNGNTGLAADIAPEQAAEDQGYTLTVGAVGGAATGGDFKIAVDYLDGTQSAPITVAWNAVHGTIKTSLVTLDDGYDTNDWTTSATGALPGGVVTIVPPPGVELSVVDNDLTGPGAPYTVTIAPAP